ncbi:MAG: sigma-70 family RNA polymerase sigma factor [Acidobacteriota bacterium]
MSDSPPAPDGSTRRDVTRLLLDWRSGDRDALDQLMPLVYDELRGVARRQMRAEGPITLQPTALVNEAYLRLVDLDVHWQDRVHFFALAASLMRRILIDEARRRNSKKRGAGDARLTLEDFDGADETPAELIALDDGLADLARYDERKAKAIELRFFGGLTIDETAEALGVGHATVERDVKLARAWLARHLSHSTPGP